MSIADVVRYEAAPVSEGSRRGRSVLAAWPYAAAVLIGLAAWQLGSMSMGERSFLLPPPGDVLTTSFLDWSHLSRMLEALWLTTRVALGGLAIAAALGIAIAVLMSQSRILEKGLYPYAVLLQTLPVLALVPLIGLWLGFGTVSRTTVVIIFALFPMISNTFFGLQSVDPGARDFFRIRRAGRWQVLTKLQLPSALPAMFVGLRTSSGLAVVGAIVGDMFFAQGAPGIGTLVNLYTARLQSADLYASILLSSLLGIVVFGAFSIISRLAIGSWHASTHHGE